VGVYWLQVWVNDTYGNVQTATLQVKVQDTTPPVMVNLPANCTVEEGGAVNLQLEAWDLSGISHWDVNDTVRFAITTTGWLFTPAPLPLGTYHVLVVAYDPYHNHLTATITVQILPAAPPDWVRAPADQWVEFGDGTI